MERPIINASDGFFRGLWRSASPSENEFSLPWIHDHFGKTAKTDGKKSRVFGNSYLGVFSQAAVLTLTPGFLLFWRAPNQNLQIGHFPDPIKNKDGSECENMLKNHRFSLIFHSVAPRCPHLCNAGHALGLWHCFAQVDRGRGDVCVCMLYLFYVAYVLFILVYYA